MACPAAGAQCAVRARQQLAPSGGRGKGKLAMRTHTHTHIHCASRPDRAACATTARLGASESEPLPPRGPRQRRASEAGRAAGRDGTAGRYDPPKKILYSSSAGLAANVLRVARGLGAWAPGRGRGRRDGSLSSVMALCLRAPAGRSPDRFTLGFGRARAGDRSGGGGGRRRTNDRSTAAWRRCWVASRY